VGAVASANGVLVYVAGSGAGPQRTLMWVDRQGQETPIVAPPRAYVYPRLSPDGTRVALFVNDQERDIWLWDLARRTLTRVTFDPAVDIYNEWTPDGGRLVFSSERAGVRNLFAQAADGTGAIERMTESPNTQNASAVSPDGTRLIFAETTTETGVDILQMSLNGARRVTPLLQTQFNEQNGILSPDGRWLAYEADNSGQLEVYVRPFPEVSSGNSQVSTGGGTRPLWARNGQELFYLSPTGALMRVGVERGPSWRATTPSMVLQASEGAFRVPYQNLGRTYDISPDGRRFLMIKTASSAEGATPPQIIVVQSWFEELKRLVPTN
jgi:serine/threonine-protein kinase